MMVVRTIERKGTYQCFFHKRDRANRTLYKTENIRKLPSRVYQDYRRRRDHRLLSSINQERELFRHTEQIQSKRPAVAPRHRGKAKSLQERISIQLSASQAMVMQWRTKCEEVIHTTHVHTYRCLARRSGRLPSSKS